MRRTRLEAFSDGVLAIVITIMVLELKVPHEVSLKALSHLTPEFLTYVLSFSFLGIYWNNHHHMLHLVERVNGWTLWANLHLLFWLSLIPFVTGWMGQNHFAPLPTATYGAVLLLAALAYRILQTTIITQQGPNSSLKKAIGNDLKGKFSFVLYLMAVPLAFFNRWIAIGIYIAVALMWLVPDRRIETFIRQS